jgi:hypothetical protein
MPQKICHGENSNPEAGTPLAPLRTCACRRQIFHTFPERAGGSCTTGAAWSLPLLRTDSVNRGFCISLLTLAIVVLALSFRGCRFFIVIPRY